MPYRKDKAVYYLDDKDKRFISNKIRYYSSIVEKKENKPQEWFKISKYWFDKSKKSISIKYTKIYKIIAKRCYKLYILEKEKQEKDKKGKKLKIGDFF